jgi:SAM-dependent methyltransferase
MQYSSGPLVSWVENGRARQARWLTADDRPVPPTIQVAGDGLTADHALTLASTSALLWRGDLHQARQLLDAMRRRLHPRPPRRALGVAAEFRRHRQHRARVARLLGAIVVELRPGGELPLRRAPRVAAACAEVYGEIPEPSLVALRELLGVLNVHHQRHTGIRVAALGGALIHPHYGVFAPTRQDYLDLVTRVPLPVGCGTAFDIGTGTGVLAALLHRRGVGRVVATDIQPRAVACARDNLDRLGLTSAVDVLRRDLFPPGRADLVVANPPWLPGTPASTAETGVYDRHGAMTARFLRGLTEHLTPRGEAWLIQSDLAEHLELRPPGHIPTLVARAGLRVRDVLETVPGTRKRADDDLIAHARRRERLQLWRLGR